MNPTTTALVGLFLVETVVLVASTVAIATVLLRKGWAVVYTRGMRLLLGTLVLLTAAAVLNALVKADLGGITLQYAAHLGFTAASVTVFAAAWYFARDFITVEEQEPPSVDVVSEDTGGFEDA